MTNSKLNVTAMGALALASLMATSALAGARSLASEGAQKTAFQDICEKVDRNLPKDYQAQYQPADKNSPQMCQVYSPGFDHSVGFGLVKTFNEACVSDGSLRGVQLAPAPCIDSLKTCVLNLRCAPNE